MITLVLSNSNSIIFILVRVSLFGFHPNHVLRVKMVFVVVVGCGCLPDAFESFRTKIAFMSEMPSYCSVCYHFVARIL